MEERIEELYRILTKSKIAFLAIIAFLVLLTYLVITVSTKVITTQIHTKSLADSDETGYAHRLAKEMAASIFENESGEPPPKPESSKKTNQPTPTPSWPWHCRNSQGSLSGASRAFGKQATCNVTCELKKGIYGPSKTTKKSFTKANGWSPAECSLKAAEVCGCGGEIVITPTPGQEATNPTGCGYSVKEEQIGDVICTDLKNGERCFTSATITCNNTDMVSLSYNACWNEYTWAGQAEYVCCEEIDCSRVFFENNGRDLCHFKCKRGGGGDCEGNDESGWQCTTGKCAKP